MNRHGNNAHTTPLGRAEMARRMRETACRPHCLPAAAPSVVILYSVAVVDSPHPNWLLVLAFRRQRPFRHAPERPGQKSPQCVYDLIGMSVSSVAYGIETVQ